jgi:hypothetical protein
MAKRTEVGHWAEDFCFAFLRLFFNVEENNVEMAPKRI